jgi:threonine synthase
MATASFVSGLRCPRCDATYDHLGLHNVCSCGSPLLVEYDLERVAGSVDRAELPARSPTMWRYRELLPVEDPGRIVSLGEGFTPLLPAPRLAARAGVAELWIKDDGLNPTGSFKARGAACGMTAAVERGVREVALPTAGNAGGAWAAYGAAAGVRVHVAMPADAPAANRLECLAFGAEVTAVDGLISDAGRLVREWVEANGWFDVSALREPYRIEGKKTLGLEIVEQLAWRPPDVIVYPAGGGVGLIGIDRALRQLRAMGWVDGSAPPPRLVVVQAEGCAPLVRAFREGREECEPWPDASTLAAGLRVPKALGDFLVLRALRETDGTAVAVADREILAAMRTAGEIGVQACPEGAATLAALGPLRDAGWLGGGERVVVVNTGTALKYPEAMALAAGEAPR